MIVISFEMKKILNFLLNILSYRGKYCSNSGDRISRSAYHAINFSCPAKRRNITGIPSIIPIVFPLITRKLNIISVHAWIRKVTCANIHRPFHNQPNWKIIVFCFCKLRFLYLQKKFFKKWRHTFQSFSVKAVYKTVCACLLYFTFVRKHLRDKIYTRLAFRTM